MTGPIALIPDDQAARVGGADIPLGDREFALLAALVRRPHIVCRMALLARETWGASAVEDHTHVKHLIFRLRRKLGPAANWPRRPKRLRRRLPLQPHRLTQRYAPAHGAGDRRSR